MQEDIKKFMLFKRAHFFYEAQEQSIVLKDMTKSKGFQKLSPQSLSPFALLTCKLNKVYSNLVPVVHYPWEAPQV